MKEEFSLAYPPEEAYKYLEFEEEQHQADVLLEEAVEKVGIKGYKVLDYGCGFGRMVPMLLRQDASEVVGCDPSAPMIEEAERRLASGKFGEAAPIHFEILKGLPLPYQDKSFDGILLRFVFHYILDTAPVLKEFARILRPGGWVIAIFSDVHLKPGNEDLINTVLPLKFLDSLTIRTLVKQGSEIVENTKRAGLSIERYEDVPNATVVSIDSKYPHLNSIERFETGFLVARK